MIRAFVFSGTTEGREISQFLSENRIYHRVFVATEYGQVVMESSEYTDIETGRLNEAQMEVKLDEFKPELVVDATHPYAVEVTANIRAACQKCGITYLRIQRDQPVTEQLLREDYPDIAVVVSTEEAIDYLKDRPGQVLLTTGVKTLGQYAAVPGLRDRLVARILPSVDSLTQALDTGLKPRQLVAMEGPFTVSANTGLIDQYGVSTLVTKNSGIKGGFLEKLEACKLRNIQALVIDSGKYTEGLSLEEGEREIQRLLNIAVRASKVTIAGIGVGNEETMPVATVKAIRQAGLIIGARRMVELGSQLNPNARIVTEYQADRVLEAIKANSGLSPIVLVSGDSGFYSGARDIYRAVLAAGYEARLLPAVSSVSYFSSLIGVPYSDGTVVSLHGTDCDYMAALREHGSLFAIVSGLEDVMQVANSVWSEFPEACIHVGYNLGQPDEAVHSFEGRSRLELNKDGLYVMGVFING